MEGVYLGHRFRYWRDEGWFVGQLIDCPSALTQARTLHKLRDDLLSIRQVLLTVSR